MLFADEEDVYVVEMYDVLGRMIRRGEQHLGELRFHEFEFQDLGTLQRGVYLIRAGSRNETKIIRVVKM
jgi:hypothetical protein